MKFIIYILFALTIISCSSDSQDGPALVDPTRPDSKPTITPGNSTEGFNSVELNYFELDSSVYGFLVNKLEPQFSSPQYTLKRNKTEFHETDLPNELLTQKDIFSSFSTFYIDQSLFNIKPRIESLSPYYGVPSSQDQHHLSGISQSELCISTSSSLAQTIKDSKVPDEQTIEELNVFEKRINSLREETIYKSSKTAKIELIRTWSKFMGCLAYTESLTSADVSSSYKVSEEYSPKGFEKPKGVKFYEDPYQDATSRLNIGLYQFTPNSSGNIYPCVLQWNDFFPENKIDTRADQNELIRVFGSSFQSMNAFCGINKVVQTFAIQVNTDEQKRTHPGNRDGQSLKASSNRCVTPWFYASYAYNHFGPLQNSTGNNLKKLITCVNGE